MKSPALIVLLWFLVPTLSSGEPAALSVFSSAFPTGTKVTVSSIAKEFVIDIETPDTHPPFWRSQPTVRIPYSTHLPAISLVANIGRSEEVRLVFHPRNVGHHFDAPPEQLMLESDGMEIGKVVLFTQEGEIDTHRARYIIQQDAVERLGTSFVLISGNPFTHHIETKKPNES